MWVRQRFILVVTRHEKLSEETNLQLFSHQHRGFELENIGLCQHCQHKGKTAERKSLLPESPKVVHEINKDVQGVVVELVVLDQLGLQVDVV